MNITDKQTAIEFANAWQSHGTRGAWMMRHAAEGQRACAGLARQLGRSLEARRHEAAAAVLTMRASR